MCFEKVFQMSALNKIKVGTNLNHCMNSIVLILSKRSLIKMMFSVRRVMICS